MPLELTGQQFKPLSQALRETLRLSQFDQMLKQRLNINREDIALGDDFTDIVFRVIGEANRSGWVYLLVNAAREERPKNPTFMEYARILGIAPIGTPDPAQLQSIINQTNALLDVALFRSRLGEIEGQVCRVDLLNEGRGTGFLVGPSTVMTNYHVIESVVKKEHTIDQFSCRFDFKVRAGDGTSVNQGTPFQVTHLAAFSPYDAADLNRDGQVPDANNLDYALLTLDGEPGEGSVGHKASDTSEKRGWMTIADKDHNFAPGSPLFIVQHPNKRPMKLALDTGAVIRVNNNSTRVEYRTNTEPGSSGSPCFSQNWDLVALHHSGDPAWVPTWNEGIPMKLIADHLKATNSWQQIV